MRLTAVILLSGLLPTAASASSFSEATGNNSCASHLTTCASVQVEFVRMGATTPSVVTIRGSGVYQQMTSSLAVPSFRITPSPGEGFAATNPHILAIYWGDDGRPVECRPGGHDCRIDSVTTPEPITMTLLATGLVGMAGAARLRRRVKK